MTETTLTLVAPLSGLVVRLADVPDPVFASNTVGEGIAIEPTSAELLAPLAGTITQLHRAHHAVSITTREGLEVLVHIGIDTVSLKGAGFEALVAQGDRVEAGQALIRFDADFVASRVLSLACPIVITNTDRIRSMVPAVGSVIAGRDVVLTVTLRSPEVAGDVVAGASVARRHVVVPNPQGLHARPAAVLAVAAKAYRSEIRLIRGDVQANAKSVVSLMVLETKAHDELILEASGVDAGAAVDALSALINSGCGESTTERAAPAAPVARVVAKIDGAIGGTTASPGVAVGPIVQLRRERIEVVEQGQGERIERAHLETALTAARQEIDTLKARLADPSGAGILEAHRELLEDPELVDGAIAELSAGLSAGAAWRNSVTRYAERLGALQSALLRERAQDVRDVGDRVLALITGVRPASLVLLKPCILVADELTPSETAAFDREKVLGFCTVGGGATGHVAILARSLGIPALCGIEASARSLADGTLAVLDAGRGLLKPHPSDAEIAAATSEQTQLRARRDRDVATASESACTTDGHRVEVAANVGAPEESLAAVGAGADGVGLLRSEFLFLDRATAPSEEEQSRAYASVANALGATRPLVIRTLDVGGDKALPYLPIPAEENPFLGLRGIRVSLAHEALFRTQLRAILRGGAAAALHVMFPMVTDLEEFRAAKRMLAEEAGGSMPKVGLMIEVPAAALMADVFAPEVDFFSIGTNDLTQYALAMDRGHPKLAAQADGLHPAVLRLIRMTVDAAHRHGKWVGVCGGLAAEPEAVPVLLGLGVDELSVPVPAIPGIKADIRRLSQAACVALATEVLSLAGAQAVRARARTFLDSIEGRGR
jgi:multiphosphoryl transfer protein